MSIVTVSRVRGGGKTTPFMFTPMYFRQFSRKAQDAGWAALKKQRTGHRVGLVSLSSRELCAQAYPRRQRAVWQGALLVAIRGGALSCCQVVRRVSNLRLRD